MISFICIVMQQKLHVTFEEKFKIQKKTFFQIINFEI